MGTPFMILLDTNYLIKLLVQGSPEAEMIKVWYLNEDLCTSAISWYEFVCGPVNDEGIMVVRSLLHDRILPFTADQATESVRLYNASGRKRNLRVDAMIAASAIVPNAELATGNIGDFAQFVPLGLRLRQTV
jgi:predicted nucleic acid-binding protein